MKNIIFNNWTLTDVKLNKLLILTDANLEQIRSVDRRQETIDNINFYAQTFLTIKGKNAFTSDEIAQQFKDNNQDDRWVVRSYSARFNNNKSKLIIEYREKLPAEIQTLSTLPYGYGNFLQEFAERSRKCFQIKRPETAYKQLDQIELSNVRLRYLDQHFFGTATLVSAWPRQ